MIETLQFVRGAVSNTDNVAPVLTRFCISGGRIQGSNGRVAIESPIAELVGIEALVSADRFLAALDSCAGEPKISLTENGKLSIAFKPFRAVLPVTPPDQFPRLTPTEGKRLKLPKNFLDVVSALRPFMGEDSTRAWCLTMVADGERAYATNSNMIACADAKGLKFQLPSFTVDELIRIGLHPDGYITDGNSITFFYDEAWLRSQLIEGEWPIKTAQDRLGFTQKIDVKPERLVKEIESLLPFCADLKFPEIHFTDKGISTVPGDTQAEIEGAAWPPTAFDSRNLIPMLKVATHFGIDPDTSIGLFAGAGGFRGVMAGRKVLAVNPAPSDVQQGQAPGGKA